MTTPVITRKAPGWLVSDHSGEHYTDTWLEAYYLYLHVLAFNGAVSDGEDIHQPGDRS